MKIGIYKEIYQYYHNLLIHLLSDFVTIIIFIPGLCRFVDLSFENRLNLIVF